MSEEKNKVTNEEKKAEESGAPVIKAVKPEPVTIEGGEVHAILSKYGANQEIIDKIVNDLGAESIDELASLEVSDLTGAGMKLAKAKKMVAELGAQEQESEPKSNCTGSGRAYCPAAV